MDSSSSHHQQQQQKKNQRIQGRWILATPADSIPTGPRSTTVPQEIRFQGSSSSGSGSKDSAGQIEGVRGYRNAATSCNLPIGDAQVVMQYTSLLASMNSGAGHRTAAGVRPPMPISHYGLLRYLPSLHNSSPKRRASTESRETMSPPLAPVTPCKVKILRDYPARKSISSAVEGSEEQGKKEEISMMQPTKVRSMDSKPEAPVTPDKIKRMQDCPIDLNDERLDIQQEESTSAERALSQQQETEEGDSRENQGKSLNRTPRQKIKRKKHRPKVVQEGKPAKTPKPETPSQATEKKNQIVKRHYVRKKKGLDSSDSPSTALGETIDPDTASSAAKTVNRKPRGCKSVRRSLNFDSEDQAMDALEASTTTNEKPQARETTSSTKSTMKLPQGLEVVLENSEAGFTFDLNRSLNQVLEEYIRSPVSTTAAWPSTEELIREFEQHAKVSDKKNISDHCPNQSPENPTQLCQQSRREMLWENLKQINQKCPDSNILSDSVLTEDDDEKTRAKRDCSHVDQASKCHEMSNLVLNYPKVYKKRRTEKGQALVDNQKVHCDPTYLTLEKMDVMEPLLGFGRTEGTKKKRSDLPIRIRQPASLATILECNQLLRTSEHQPQDCMEALLSDLRLKLTKTKKRSKNRQVHLVRSKSSNKNQEYELVSCKFNSIKKSLVLAASPALKFKVKKTSHLLNSSIQGWGSSRNFQASLRAGFQSRAIVRYVDPIDDIVHKLKCLNLNGGQADTTAPELGALVPYGGGGMIVPHKRLLDPTKKRRPRAKVDLDPESNRVWMLLMGKEARDEAEGSDMDKEKWWEEQRRVFRGRVDSFIARMHLVQGDRRFSQWKGSVVDSVVGVFLTQNVSDNLSSSAFMSLAARFPIQSGSNNMEPNAEKMNMSTSQETGSNLPIDDDAIKWQEGMPDELMEEREMASSNISLGSNHLGGKGLHAHGREDHEAPEIWTEYPVTITGSTSSLETEDRRSPEDVVSSQNSAISSANSCECPIEATDQVGSNSERNSEADQIIGTIELDGPDIVKSVCSSVYAADSNSNHAEHNFGGHLFVPSTWTHFHDSSYTGLVHYMEKDVRKENGSYVSLAGSEVTYANNVSSLTRTEATGEQKLTIATNAQAVDSHASICEISQELLNCSETDVSLEMENIQHEHGAKFQQEGMKEDFHVENIQHEVDDLVQIQQCKMQNTCSNSCETSEAVEAVESKTKNEGYSPQKALLETAKKTSRTKTVKAETGKKIIEWDNLRKEACRDGAEIKRSDERVDSLDWEAVRGADVEEISNTIRGRGMNNVLAERIKDFLNRLVRDHGSIDLEWLRNAPPDKAKEYLLSIRGLGLKSVECVRLLTLNNHAFPVDTNVGRICVRLGWVPLQPLPESLQLHLLELYPVMETIQKYLWPRLCTLDQQTLYELHYQLITFGKVFCTKRRPNCNACPMRGECRHFASAFASARLALPGPDNHRDSVLNTIPLPQLDGPQILKGTVSNNCEPIIEEPATPEPECQTNLGSDIEDFYSEDPNEIPLIEVDLEGLTQNLLSLMQENSVELQDGDLSKAIVAITAEAASIPMPKLKNVTRLRTEHQVYEIPDSHPLLESLDKREPDDPCPYLLAIWTPGETARSIEPPETRCSSQDTGNLCYSRTCFACNSTREAQAQAVRGTLLIPCRTAMRGSFPLNGTYFQVNEVFADHDSSCNPIYVPREWIWNLPRRTVYFGTSVPTIFRGLTTENIQHCFWRGYVCVRGFDRTTRGPRPLKERLHCSAYRASRNKKAPAEED